MTPTQTQNAAPTSVDLQKIPTAGSASKSDTAPSQNPKPPAEGPKKPVGDFEKFAALLAKLESGGMLQPYKAVNQYGYVGKYQHGVAALMDAGHVKFDRSIKGNTE